VPPEGGPVYFNKRYQDHLRSVFPSYEALGELGIGGLLENLVHPEDAREVERALRNCFETGAASRMRFRWRENEGAYRWAECRVEPRRDQDGAIVQWYGVSLDIDDEVRAKEAQRDRELELSQFIDMVPVYIARMAPDGEPTFFSKRTVDLVGVDVEAFDKPGVSRLAAAMAAAIHPEDVGLMNEKLGRSLVTGEPYSLKYRHRCPDGVYRWMHGRAEPLRDRDGAIMHWYAAIIDIDDEVRAQETLRDRERELSHLVDMVPSHVWRLTPEGEPNFYNKRLLEYFGLETANADKPGMSRLEAAIEAAIHPDDAASVGEALNHSFVTGERFALKYRLRRADGVYRWMSGRAEPLRDENGRILEWYGLAHDIDDQVHAEEALRRASDKLAQATRAASLAELSASIAHEVNQPLAAIVANSQACQQWLSVEPPNIERAKTTAERIIRDANSASDVVSRIRALFRQAPDARSSEDVNRLIAEVCRLMADVIAAKDVRIKTNLEPDLPSIALDRVQVQQVLVNLIRNGIEAMDGVIDRARALLIRSCRDGLDAVRVEVRDAGTGIDDAERVFEPFFTTKRQGMGMGLAICRSIVESHGGRLWMANNETCGALAAFTLPLSANGPAR